MPLRLVPVAALILAGGLLASCSSASPSSEDAVLVFGDSLVNGGAATIASGLDGAGWDPVVDGRPGWSIGKWAGALGPVVDEVRPRIAVVVLGTNDCAPVCREVAGGIDRIMATLTDAGAQRVFWFNVQQRPDYPENPGRVNLELESATGRWSRLSIVDLDGTLGDRPELHTSDGVHFTDAGNLALTALILETVDAAR
jgi:hypothetical protein